MKKAGLIILFGLMPLALLAQAPVDTANIYVDTTGQKDLLDFANHILKLKKRKYPKEKKQVYFSILPLSTRVPGGGKALVTSTTAGFYLGPRRTTYLSSATFAPYFNFKGRYGLPIHSSLWLRDNSYNIQGDTRFLINPEYTWGLGGGQRESDKILVNDTYIRFYQSVLKRITPYLYAGVGYNLDYFININSADAASLADFTGYPYGTGQNSNSFSSGVSINLLYDSRKNIFNPIPGGYANIIFRHDTKLLGSQDNIQTIYIDLRKYIPLNNSSLKNQLALWTYYWTCLSSGTPYLELPGIGNDPYQRSGRGIQQNRYRGRSLVYFEAEYRRDITRNGLLGFVLFANINSASQPEKGGFKYWNPAGGGGLRLKFNKKSDTNICIDYGVSKGYSDIILGLGEAF